MVNQSISIDKIAWKSDVEYKFKNIKEDQVPDLDGVNDWRDIQWLDMENQHFIVWMRTAGLPDFRKLWGVMDDGLTKGTYELRVYNRFDTTPFNGTKSFVLATATVFGGKNDLLGNSFLFLGIFSIIFGILSVFMVKRRD